MLKFLVLNQVDLNLVVKFEIEKGTYILCAGANNVCVAIIFDSVVTFLSDFGANFC